MLGEVETRHPFNDFEVGPNASLKSFKQQPKFHPNNRNSKIHTARSFISVKGKQWKYFLSMHYEIFFKRNVTECNNR